MDEHVPKQETHSYMLLIHMHVYSLTHVYAEQLAAMDAEQLAAIGWMSICPNRAHTAICFCYTRMFTQWHMHMQGS